MESKAKFLGHPVHVWQAGPAIQKPTINVWDIQGNARQQRNERKSTGRNQASIAVNIVADITEHMQRPE